MRATLVAVFLGMMFSTQGWANSGPDDPAGTPSPTPRPALRLGVYHREADAWLGWKTLMRQYPDLLEGLTSAVQPIDLGRNGRFSALIVEGEPGRDLDNLCRRMLGKGMGCFPATVGDAAPPPQPPVPAVPRVPVPVAIPVPAPVPVPVPVPVAMPVSAPVPVAMPVPAPGLAPKRGDRIVISIADRQLYYTTLDGAQMTFPIAIGRDPTLIVTGRTEIVRKRTNPTWVPTPDMRRKDPKLPASVGPGPRNPMGAFALDLGWQYIRIHGTNDPNSIGNAASSGCYRMHTQDIKTLYSLTGVGTPVEVVNASVVRGEIARASW